ncbi:hypothetical protein N0V93_003465 [Gnomoniopsis smithogilvyi]|uniref:Uncharacterized protein n=1 Tax=Gnomoniopsis smithogilvyi TaxID=1191159 RepID=A0A9W8YZA8_9PEZI|nr:hypothetical protein N0V93_003465 [Gnomoniopsis smithogilvyi]
MARERNITEKAEAEWNKQKQAALDMQVKQWGDTGLKVPIERMAAIGPKPRGTTAAQVVEGPWKRERRRV